MPVLSAVRLKARSPSLWTPFHPKASGVARSLVSQVSSRAEAAGNDEDEDDRLEGPAPCHEQAGPAPRLEDNSHTHTQ